MTVYRRPDPIPRHSSQTAHDLVLHAVRTEQEDLPQLVSRQIVTAILTGAYPEGSILPNEEALCAELGVSRTALREAVKGLAAKGILETKRRRGTLVLPRARWNLFDRDVIDWLRRQNEQAVTTQLLETLGAVVAGAAAMAASHRTASGLLGVRLTNGDARLEARSEFLVELGAASNNAFMASIISTSVFNLLAQSPHDLDRWSAWLTASFAERLVHSIAQGDVSAAAHAVEKATSIPLSFDQRV